MENQENYTKEKLTIDLVWANIFGVIILIPIVLMYGLPYFLIWKDEFQFSDFSLIHFIGKFWLVFAFIIAGVVAHELIHGIVWAKYAKNGFRSIKFGVMWKMLTPYCHCIEPLKVSQYIIGAIMPSIILGLIPAILAIITGNFLLLVFGIFFTMAACGDFLTIYALRNEKMDYLVEDHPSEAGCFVYRPIEN